MSHKLYTGKEAAIKDELFTQYHDIQNEINAYTDYNPDVFRNKIIMLPCDDPLESNFLKFFALNFERLGIKKIISTSYAPISKKEKYGFTPDHFESTQNSYGNITKGKVYTLSSDMNGDGKIDSDDITWNYLEGDGNFLSDEVSNLCDECDMVIAHPPFTLFADFADLLIKKNKDFIIIGNTKHLVNRVLLDYVVNNKIWIGNGFKSDKSSFSIPPILKNEFKLDPSKKKYGSRCTFDHDTGLVTSNEKTWITNIDHGIKHEPLSLMTKEENLKFNKKVGPYAKGNGKYYFHEYQNYNAMEIPFVDAIPTDYAGLMGVPFTFLKKHCLEQFEILGIGENLDLFKLKTKIYTRDECKDAGKLRGKSSYDLNACPVLIKNGKLTVTFERIFIKHKNL